MVKKIQDLFTSTLEKYKDEKTNVPTIKLGMMDPVPFLSYLIAMMVEEAQISQSTFCYSTSGFPLEEGWLVNFVIDIENVITLEAALIYEYNPDDNECNGK